MSAVPCRGIRTVTHAETSPGEFSYPLRPQMTCIFSPCASPAYIPFSSSEASLPQMSERIPGISVVSDARSRWGAKRGFCRRFGLASDHLVFPSRPFLLFVVSPTNFFWERPSTVLAPPEPILLFSVSCRRVSSFTSRLPREGFVHSCLLVLVLTDWLTHHKRKKYT